MRLSPKWTWTSYTPHVTPCLPPSRSLCQQRPHHPPSPPSWTPRCCLCLLSSPLLPPESVSSPLLLSPSHPHCLCWSFCHLLPQKKVIFFFCIRVAVNRIPFSCMWYPCSSVLDMFRPSPGGSVAKNLPANAGDSGWIPGLGRSPGWREWQPTPVSLPGKSHGQRTLAGYSPWDCKESEMTEWLNHHSNDSIWGTYPELFCRCENSPPNSRC